MKRFFVHILFIMLPIVAILALPIGILWGTSENYCELPSYKNTPDTVLFGYAYNQKNYKYLKWTVLQEEHFSVVSLGSSRALQFREEMFTSSFYNAGFTIENIQEFLPFLKSIPESNLPDVLLVALDHWTFNANWDDLSIKPNKNKWRNAFVKYPYYETVISVYDDLIQKKYGLSIVRKNNKYDCIGLDAALHADGFRKDGSKFYNSHINVHLRKHRFNPANRFAQGFLLLNKPEDKSSYMGGDTVHGRAVDVVIQFINYCQANDIRVVCYLPPFAETVYSEMKASGNHDYLNALPALLHGSLPDGCEYYDFSSPASFSSSDSEMIDGKHGSEMAYAKMLLAMCRQGSLLNLELDSVALKNAMLNPENRYTIYGYGNKTTHD